MKKWNWEFLPGVVLGLIMSAYIWTVWPIMLVGALSWMVIALKTGKVQAYIILAGLGFIAVLDFVYWWLV